MNKVLDTEIKSINDLTNILTQINRNIVRVNLELQKVKSDLSIIKIKLNETNNDNEYINIDPPIHPPIDRSLNNSIFNKPWFNIIHKYI